MSSLLPSLAASISLLLAWPLFCHAQPSSVQWWDDTNVVETIGLTAEQQQQIRMLVQRSHEERATLRPKIKELQKTVSQLLGAPQLDEQQIFTTLTALSELYFRQRKDVVTMRVRVRQVLSPEQFDKLLALKPNVMRQRWVPRRVVLEGQQPPAKREEKPQVH